MTKSLSFIEIELMKTNSLTIQVHEVIQKANRRIKKLIEDKHDRLRKLEQLSYNDIYLIVDEVL